ncbi:hypothetical protein [Robbsia andropogonis]|uniref:hypothetical protein n=1 Tax=Robbsia andropogonis TaxID=28092 RepID=UPI002A6B4F84|nr:hypothetical protein [Robbsia andropogonis]
MLGGILGLIRKVIRGLLLFIVTTSLMGFVFWLIKRHSTLPELIEVAIVVSGWVSIAYFLYKCGWPRDSRDW